MPMAKAQVRARTRAQATQDLLELGEPAHPTWTNIELKSRIRELRAAQVVKLNVTMGRSCEEIANECMKNGIVLDGKPGASNKSGNCLWLILT